MFPLQLITQMPWKLMAGRKFLQTKPQFSEDTSPRSSFVLGILQMTCWLQGKQDSEDTVRHSLSVFCFQIHLTMMSKDFLFWNGCVLSFLWQREVNNWGFQSTKMKIITMQFLIKSPKQRASCPFSSSEGATSSPWGLVVMVIKPAFWKHTWGQEGLKSRICAANQ